ncbi:D-alanyl-D-alanine carboxypeptidase [Bacillus sp. P1(2020)]|uniref:serine-type D-Ala-D-Ala carboxypeptidase n=1 Tax=Pallidibacillus pasinlerensis TaxID=2703818 RepID=A0ABX0A9Q3_9BACI|nr:D-alanyl-D-alanine carboxypeptidase [Pallidibacillus pasinlerensis]
MTLEGDFLTKIIKRIFIYTLLSFFVLPMFIGAGTVSAASNDPLNLQGEAAILIDADTGKVLYEKNADQLLGVASMSKMMTEYLVLEAIAEGKIQWDQKVLISEFIHKLSNPSLGLSTVGLTQGEEYTVKELYDSMAIHSANASTVALAELIAGSEENFVKMMNEKAEELGLENYHFVNSTGLNNSDMLGRHPAGTDVNDENKMTARDTAKLAYHLLKDYPEVLDTASQSELNFRGTVYKNFNWMLPGLIFEYAGVDGLKTGSTKFAGYGFTATAVLDGQRYISVVMKAPNQEARFTDTRNILNYAKGNFNTTEIVAEKEEIEGNDVLHVEKGKENIVKIAPKESLNLVIKNGEEENYKAKVVIDEDKLNDNGALIAPVKKGDVVGYVTYEYTGEGEDLGFLYTDKTVKVDLVATEDVEKANWFVLMLRGIGEFFVGLWNGITTTVAGWFS